MYSSRENLEKVKRKIGEASGKDFVVEVVKSIGGDANQAQAQTDGFTVKIGKGLVDNLDEDELASVIAHEVAHLEKRAKKNADKEEEVGFESFKKNINKMDESLRSSGAGVFVRTIAQIAVVGIGVAGGIAIAQGKRRKSEEAADSRAVDILHEAGYDPEATVRVLEKYDRKAHRRRGFLEDVLSTHPETGERIRNIQEKARDKKK